MKPFYEDGQVTIHNADCRNMSEIANGSIQCCVTSPPYWGLRDYGVDGQIGLEKTPEAYVASLVDVFREVKRVLRPDGTVWLNLGDSYGGSGKVPDDKQPGVRDYISPPYTDTVIKPKDLVGIPWRVAFALQADGWWLRQDIIWSKPNPMPESVTDRCTKSHEYLFLLAKSQRYYYDQEAIRESQAEASFDRAKYGWAGRTDDGSNGARTGSSFKRMAQSGEPIATIPADGKRNRRSVWTIATSPYKEAHFATFPESLVEPCILAGSRVGDTVLDPFAGSGTALWVAKRLGRKAVGYELKREYCGLEVKRLPQMAMEFA